MTRTRFAPSPTGFIHIGAVRTALYAWLVAQQHDGKFILRIEDTDKNREVDTATEHIKESLRWLGLDWDEGPDTEGDYGPYTQSLRLGIYRNYARQLVEKGLAYADPTSKEQLDTWRQQAKDEKRPFHFRDHRPENPPQWDGTQPLRFKIDADISPDWEDLVRGPQKGSRENIDDFIIMKADGYPTYNFAHIVDDHEMQITHVIRGEEFVSSMPKFMLLHHALGFEPPKFAHVPSILAPTGNKKLSKRDGAGDILDYRAQGYLPEGMRNFLATLGWNDGTEQEIFTTKELVEKFDLQRVQKAGARYDEQRLQWINGHHLRQLPLDELYQKAEGFWPEAAAEADDAYKKRVLSLVHERLKFLAELPELTDFFFTEPEILLENIFDKQLSKKLDNATAKTWLEAVADKVADSDFSEADLEERLRALVDELDTKAGFLFKLIRGAVTGRQVAPGLFETLSTLGRDTALQRIKKTLGQL